MPMLRSVVGVRDEVVKRCAGREHDLETITKVFIAVTVVDFIVYAPYETPSENPIWGEFGRWSKSPAPYAASETIVEVRYASHLSEAWRRFVVCKELCHSLEALAGSHDVTQEGIDSLVSYFSLASATTPKAAAGKITHGVRLEILAEAGAIELLCPIDIRKKRTAAGTPDDDTLAKFAEEFNIPLEYAKVAFDPDQIQAIEWLMQNDA